MEPDYIAESDTALHPQERAAWFAECSAAARKLGCKFFWVTVLSEGPAREGEAISLPVFLRFEAWVTSPEDRDHHRFGKEN